MLTLRDPTLLDLLAVSLALPAEEREVHRSLFGGEYDPEAVAVAAFSMSGPRWCIADVDDRALVVCGYTNLHPGTYRSWYLATAAAWHPHGAGVTALTRTIVEGMLAERFVNRLETVTLASCMQARRWYGRLGLQFESTLKSFAASGEPAVMYVARRANPLQ